MLDERDLVSRMQRGDQQAFNEFFDTFAPRLSSLILDTTASMLSLLAPSSITTIMICSSNRRHCCNSERNEAPR